MRIITLKQPYAHAVVHLGKSVENRTRNVAGDYRGPVLIHAGKTFVEDAPAQLRSAFLANDDAHVYGAIIGVVELVGVHPWKPHNPCRRVVVEHLSPNIVRGGYQSPCSPWALESHHHLVLASPRALDEPIPYQGRLGLLPAPFAVAGDWLMRSTDTCTCGPGPLLGATIGHEPGCGWEPAARLTKTGGAG